MKTFPVQIVGPAYEDRSKSYSAQSTINLYPSRPIEGRSVRKLHRWPGSKLFATGAGVNRSGLVGMGALSYKVSGASLVSIDSSGTVVSLGAIPGSGRCNISTDGTNIIVSTGTARYQYNVPNGLTVFSDPDHEPGNTSTFMNRRIIMDGAGGQFQVATLDDPDDINSLNFATAESSPDDTIAVYAFKERVMIAGTETIEPWYNDGTADFPPFSRIEGGVHQFGLGAIHSFANDDSYVYCLSSDKHIYRMVDIDAQRMTPIPMERFLEDNEISDAIGWCMSFAGQWFYCLTFPTANKSWVIPVIDPDSAFQVSSDLVRGRHLADSYCFCFGKHLVSDYRNGNIYELDVSEFQDAGENVLIERAIAPLNAEAFGQPGDEITVNEFDLIMETGTGNPNDLDPVGIFDLSVDGGRSFTNEQWVRLGFEGEEKQVKYHFKRVFRDGVIRFRVVDPINVSLHSASVRMKAGGKK